MHNIVVYFSCNITKKRTKPSILRSLIMSILKLDKISIQGGYFTVVLTKPVEHRK